MKSKITIVTIFLAFIITGCYSSNENEATLTLHLGGSSNSYSASALTHWPPSNADELGSLSYEIRLKSSSGAITEKEALGSDSMITFDVTPGYWTIEVTAKTDGELYAYGINGVTARPGQNHVVVTMYRAGNYDIKINVLPSDISIPKGVSYLFSANTFYGSLVNSSDRIHDSYNWSVSGQKSGATTINASTGDLTVDLNETASTLTVKAESVNKSSIFGTATVTVTERVNAQSPVIITQPQNVTYTIGDTVALTVAATSPDGGVLSYQWYTTDGSSDGTAITNATGAGYIPDIAAAGIYYYYVVVTNTNTSNNINGNTTAIVKSNVVTVTGIFMSVTDITDMPTTIMAGDPLTLTGTVVPNNATNNTILWSIQSAGSTGATINNNILNTTAAGTVTVRATITNGKDIGTDYTKDFIITVVFVPVTDITDVPTTVMVGDPLTLTGTVIPSNATNQTILWGVQNAGSTGATINNNILNTTAAGTITVRATITNGKAIGIDYTKDFIITVESPVAKVTISGTDTFYINLNAAFESITSGTATVTVLENIPAQAPINIAGTKTINFVSDGAKEIQLGADGSLLTVGGGVTLRIGDSSSESGGASSGTLTLKGIDPNTAPLITVGEGTLELYANAIITGNRSSNTGGVYVNISGNFIMSGGTIEGNSNSYTSGRGGGVYVVGTFTMSGGTIEGNTASSGGGVYVYEGTMSGGTIAGNTASNSGGGVFVSINTIFTMSGGTIEGNSCSNSGGGVFVSYGTTFTMSGGIIYGNESIHIVDLRNTAGMTNSASLYVDSSGTAEYSMDYAALLGALSTIVAPGSGTDVTLGQ